MADRASDFDKSASSGSYIQGRIELDLLGYNYDTNSSQVSFSLFVRKGNSSMTLTTPTDGTWKYSLTVDGEKISGTKSASVLEDWVLLHTFRRSYTHQANGERWVYVTASIDAPSGTSYEGHTSSDTANFKLNTYNRTTIVRSLTCSTSYLDGTITAKYEPRAANLEHVRRVYVNVDGKLTLIRATDLGVKSDTEQTSNINFSASELDSIYKLLPTTTKAKIRVAFEAYESVYSTGTEQYLEITLSIPILIAPTVELTITQVNTNTWLAGKKIYAAGLSGATVAASFDVPDWTTLAAYNIVYNGTTYEATKLNITTFKNAGTYSFTAKAVDSRGRIGTTTEEITVHPYSPPAVTSIQLERGTYGDKWTAAEDGPDLRVIFKTTLGLASEGNKYGVAFEIDGKATAPSNGSTSGLSSATNCTVYFKGLNNEVSHTLKLIATDSVGKTGAAAITVPTAYVTIEFRADGKGIAFGKTSEEAGFECAFPAYFGEAVYITDKITCPNAYSLRDFNINCNWADGAGHDMLVRSKDGLTTGLGWSGSGDDGNSYETVLDVRPKKANFRGTVTAPRGRFAATTDLSGDEQNEVALRLGDEAGQHIDLDSNEIQAKQDPTTPGPLYLNLDGGDVSVGEFRIPQIQRGTVTITPSAANTPTSIDVTFPKAFSGTPTVIVTPVTSVPGTTVLGVGVNSESSTGCKIWVSRINTTNTKVCWIAVY